MNDAPATKPATKAEPIAPQQGTTGRLKARRSEAAEARITHVRRLAGCLGGAFVLALMVGDQEGTQQDFGFAFREAVFSPRIAVFLIIGVGLYLAITFGPRLRPYLDRPGLRPLGAGLLTVLVAQALLHWTDSPDIGNEGKFGTLAGLARDTGGLNSLARVYYGSFLPGFAWLLLVVVLVLGLVAVIRRIPALAYGVAVASVLFGLWALFAQAMVRGFLKYPDHSTGGAVALIGYVTVAVALVVSARSTSEVADRAGFLERVLGWRPGLLLVGLGAVVGLVGVLDATWFSPNDRNATLNGTAVLFQGEGVSALTTAYLGWLGYVLFFVTLVVAGAATYLRQLALAWTAVVLGLASTLITLAVTHNFTSVAAAKSFNGATNAWDNLGTGSWLTAAALFLFAGAGFLVLRAGRATTSAAEDADSDQVGTSRLKQPGLLGATTILVMITAALFVPPTTTEFWQTVLVSSIGIYVLLAIGLNVVVGWAGLLDLGFIAFYAIGSYTTAYFTGRLPIKPPDWLTLSPLVCIPFAIVVCLIAGVALGAPTLRLRGDYLAIVTLGFGEIIRVIANNANGFTNGPRGAFNIPSPVIHIGPINLRWGDSSLQYWYLLLVLTVIVVLLFNRLEHSRLGRAWAAVREDEVAAQATGIDTTRVKLLAFAIGASTSGLAGVFFASQIGSFTPENFVLNNSILVVAYVVFGGMGSLAGAMAGAAVLTWLPEFLRDQVPAEDRQMWIGALIMLMMAFRPQGLIPATRRKAELSGFDEQTTRPEKASVPASEGM